jgi:hypothetical protein
MTRESRHDPQKSAKCEIQLLADRCQGGLCLPGRNHHAPSCRREGQGEGKETRVAPSPETRAKTGAKTLSKTGAKTNSQARTKAHTQT